MSIEGIPEGWELVRVGTPKPGEHVLGKYGKILHCNGVFKGISYVIIRKKNKQYRSFANAFEYMQKKRDGFAVDWKNNVAVPGFHAVVSANERFIWVAFGDCVERFEWGEAFEKLEFRHTDGSTSPFGVEVTE